MISRRQFVILAGAAAATLPHMFAAEKVPDMLDHLLLGCNHLDEGIAFVEKRTGVLPAMGGIHPGRGTRNALLGLGPLHYLEVIAPDPAQNVKPGGILASLLKLESPQLLDWAVHTSDIAGVAERWRKAGVPFAGPTPGSRARPDGKMLRWQTLNIADDRNGLIPFFIQWGADTLHPSVDAPAGCKLENFTVVTPENGSLSDEFRKLGITAQVEQGTTEHLRARISGPGGHLDLGA